MKIIMGKRGVDYILFVGLDGDLVKYSSLGMVLWSNGQ